MEKLFKISKNDSKYHYEAISKELLDEKLGTVFLNEKYLHNRIREKKH